jgi:hypothetical protein
MSDKFNWKDITYFVSFLIALFTFLKTFRKKEYVSIDYKTEYGDEANLYIFAIKGIAYSVQIKNETYDILGKKYENLNISTQKFERNKNTGDESSYFPKLGENEVIEIENAFKKGKIEIEFRDKFDNRYSQTIEFDRKTNEEFKSKRYYNLSKRKVYPLWKRIL